MSSLQVLECVALPGLCPLHVTAGPTPPHLLPIGKALSTHSAELENTGIQFLDSRLAKLQKCIPSSVLIWIQEGNQELGKIMATPLFSFSGPS